MSAAQIPFPDRETVADKLSALEGDGDAFLKLIFENPAQDDNLLEGLLFYLNRQSEARFLNSLKLGRCGEWLGNNAPSRLQIRLSEVARSSQHPAFAAFRDGLTRSGGLERAYPKSSV
ncbi:hypothetical protein J5J10_07525 [Ciceribacter sp. L1K23]|uniref:hypothetical protein n=1 Tax=Ciceribacter sp. L1K23 TaxID=2820276 RepID=UPI001B82498A|nr:hypothetical protein [Ciceribacter sp. L1K23]MBR0555529.1 hypothetical protein [Ciceribacter sp. L1K23]